jgi:ATP-dependent RNA helicase DeaD
MKKPQKTPDARPILKFADLGLNSAILATLGELGYEEPTPIQQQAIPPLINGRDVLGQAATGTGKTAAFALPILNRIAAHPDGSRRIPSALVLVPTRELAMQVAEAVHRYGRSLDISVLPIYGGQAMQQQLRALRRGVDVIVATPGRVLDHIRRASVDLRGVKIVVLDEADEMLDMGFAEDLEAILTTVPAERQTALFSATMAPRVGAIARTHLSDPIRVTIQKDQVPAGKAPRVREVAFIVARNHKIETLGRVLEMESPTAALVFCRTRTEVEQLTEVLGARGYGAESLHGGLNQEQRDRVMRRFREGTTELVIATDVAARGLDIEHLSHVVNFDIPSSTESYVHRVGRTGRAGREGVAITLLEPKETRLLKSIEQAVKRKIAIETVPTVVDLRARQMELTSVALRTAIEAGENDAYKVVVEALSADHDLMDVAAAAVKMAHEATMPKGKDTPIVSLHDKDQSRGLPKGGSKRRDGKDGRHGKSRGRAGDFVRIYVPIGKRSGIRPADLVGAIANEARIDPQLIGAIDIADKFSLVEVQEEEADQIIAALRRTTIRGKTVKVRRERF